MVKPLYDFSRRFLLTVRQRTFLQASGIGLIFFGLLLLNLYRRRFFCNTLCPLGALYGLLAKYSLIHLPVNENCSKCGACANHCTYYGSPFQDYLKSECVLCLNCLNDCPSAAIDVRLQLPRPGKRPALDVGPAQDPGRGRLRPGGRGPAPDRRCQKSQGPSLYPPAGSGGRKGFFEKMHPLRRLHAGLPDQCHPSRRFPGRPGRALDPGAGPGQRLLRIRMQPLHPGMPDPRPGQPDPGRQKNSSRSARRSSTAAPATPMPTATTAPSAKSIARCPRRRSVSAKSK